MDMFHKCLNAVSGNALVWRHATQTFSLWEPINRRIYLVDHHQGLSVNAALTSASVAMNIKAYSYFVIIRLPQIGK